MAKYEFEWNDEQAAMMLAGVLKLEDVAVMHEHHEFFGQVVKEIREQKPQPLPTKTLAVIKSEATGHQYILLGITQAGIQNWYGPFDGTNLGAWVDTSELPSTFKVLFEGVDL